MVVTRGAQRADLPRQFRRQRSTLGDLSLGRFLHLGPLLRLEDFELRLDSSKVSSDRLVEQGTLVRIHSLGACRKLHAAQALELERQRFDRDVAIADDFVALADRRRPFGDHRVEGLDLRFSCSECRVTRGEFSRLFEHECAQCFNVVDGR